MVLGKNGTRKNGPREKWSNGPKMETNFPGIIFPGTIFSRIFSPGIIFPGNQVQPNRKDFFSCNISN